MPHGADDLQHLLQPKRQIADKRIRRRDDVISREHGATFDVELSTVNASPRPHGRGEETDILGDSEAADKLFPSTVSTPAPL